MVWTGALGDIPHAHVLFCAVFIPGSTLMKLAVKKDGHHFYTHINQVFSDRPPQPHNKETNENKQDCKGKDA